MSNAITYRAATPGELAELRETYAFHGLSGSPRSDQCRSFWNVEWKVGDPPFGRDVPAERGPSSLIVPLDQILSTGFRLHNYNKLSSEAIQEARVYDAPTGITLGLILELVNHARANVPRVTIDVDGDSVITPALFWEGYEAVFQGTISSRTILLVPLLLSAEQQ